MEREYRIHFRFSRSKSYKQALELAPLACRHEIRGSGSDSWHVLTFTEEQIELMAYVYDLVKGLSAAKIEGVDAGKLSRYARQGRYDYVYDTPGTRERVCAVAQRLMEQRGFTLSQLATYIIETWAPIAEDMRRVYERLASDGFVVPHGLDPRSGQQLEPQHKPQEPNPIYTEIRGLIASGEYAQAISKYYEALGDKPYGELHQELLYLKRLANVELSGRDLLAFRSESSRDDVIKNNIWEYCSCIESVLATFNSAGRASPLEILVVSVPKTMEELNERILRELNKRVSLRDGELRRLTTTMTGYIHGTFACPKGRLFDQYPNPLIYHWLREETRDVLHYPALWTTYPPSFIQEEILGKGLSLVGIDAYGHSSWRIRSSKKREPDFTSLESLKDIEVSHYGVSGMRYTGRTHEISGKSFYEIDLLTGIPWRKERNFPPLEELAEEVLREAENLLRERHGLPRIGEGWVSEMQLYNLVKEVFPDAQHHVIPAWLKPQELDVYVASRKLAFEYQGIQHFQPMEFFGGEDAFDQRQRLDARKRNKCRSAGIVLIEWRFDEPIDRAVLLQKLMAATVEP